MAGTTKLSTDIQGALSSIFILYDPAGFQQTTGTLRYLDGSLPQSDADSDWWNMVYRWTDCPVLAGLDLAITLLMLCRAKAAPVRSCSAGTTSASAVHGTKIPPTCWLAVRRSGVP